MMVLYEERVWDQCSERANLHAPMIVTRLCGAFIMLQRARTEAALFSTGRRSTVSPRREPERRLFFAQAEGRRTDVEPHARCEGCAARHVGAGGVSGARDRETRRACAQRTQRE